MKFTTHALFEDIPSLHWVRAVKDRKVTFRLLKTAAEFDAAGNLQKKVWPERSLHSTVLVVYQLVGGLVAGAFDDKEKLIGLSIGLPGRVKGRTILWSNRLVVEESARDLNIGGTLKEFQREFCLTQGIKEIYWTFDPLEARNAHLNLNKLGATVEEYAEDMYGATESEYGTDRFVVKWKVAVSPNAFVVTDDVVKRWGRLAVANEDRSAMAEMPEAPSVRVEVPEQIKTVGDVKTCLEWRRSSRQAFVFYLGAGYTVAGFYRDPKSKRCFYILKRRRK
jgi:predicted GNAT superfamily acetyltransferase